MASAPSFKGLQPGEWRQTHDLTERAKALQNLESELASRQGRPACTIKYEDWPKNQFGAFVPSRPDELSINIAMLHDDDPREAIKTAAHEGRHAYQHDCVHHPDRHPEISPETRKAWAENQENYIHPHEGQMEYERQPIEADAYNYEQEISRQYDKALAAEAKEDEAQSQRPAAEDKASSDREPVSRFMRPPPKIPPPPPPPPEKSDAQSKGRGR